VIRQNHIKYLKKGDDMRFNGFGMLLGLTAFLLAGWMGYEFYQPKGDKSYKSEDLTIVQTGPVSLPNQDTDNAQVLSKPNGENTRSALKLLSSSTKPEASSPTACFTFNAVFDQSNAVSLRDYFDVSPNQPLTLSVSNQSLCLSGFSYSDSYQVTWKAGLEALNGSELARDITKDVIFGDKPAFVGFAGEGVILPRVNAQGLAIQTVNVDALNVSIYRVTDRMLARRALSSGQNHLEGDYSVGGRIVLGSLCGSGRTPARSG